MNLADKLAKSKLSGPVNPMDILVEDNGQSLVSIENSSRIQVIPIWQEQIDPHEGPAYQKYIKANPKYKKIFVRQEVADRLEKAANLLPKNQKLIVRAGHRPIGVQLDLLNLLKENFKKENPGCTEQKALEFARTFVSDPEVKVPPHCCGAAVDVDVLNVETGQLVDFGCPVNTDSEVSFLYSNKINQEQQDNRQVLLEAMLQAGFASLANEWWHFSFGDQTWAWFYDQPNSIYGLAEPQL